MLIGASRKGFIGDLTGMEVAADRDFGTVGGHLAALSGSKGGIVRVHNVGGMREGTVVYNAVMKEREEIDGLDERERGGEGRRSGKVKRGGDVSAKKPTVVCDPYEQGGKALTPAQAANLLASLDEDWSLEGSNSTSLVRTFEHPDFVTGSKFVQQVSFLAFNNDHYPKIRLFRKLGKRKWQVFSCVELKTDVLDGLSFRDGELAMFLDVECGREDVKKLLIEEDK